MAPTDVRLSETDVVQPDILVVCDPARITPSHIEGAPDLVMEVLSPGTSAKDLREKKWLYQRSGVREYWVVDPLELYVQRFLLTHDGRYGEAEILGPQEIVPLVVLDGLTIDLSEIFESDAVPGPL
jgi:Uma2 family endonuclease